MFYVNHLKRPDDLKDRAGDNSAITLIREIVCVYRRRNPEYSEGPAGGNLPITLMLGIVFVNHMAHPGDLEGPRGTIGRFP